MIFVTVIIAPLALSYWLFMSPYSQIFGDFPYRKIGEKNKVIALTFDDGPNEPYTSQILDFLDSEGIKATFFQVAKAAQAHPEVSKRMVKSGHIIGNHSLSHSFGKYFLQPGFRQELKASQKIFNSILGKKPALFRPPWLFRTPLLLGTARSLGLKPISGVFCHNLEVFHINARHLSKTAVKRAKPGSILIFHDGYNGKGAVRNQTVEGLKLTVKALKKNGYSFVTVNTLLDIKPYH